MQDGMQVAKPNCVQATHYAMDVDQLSGVLVTMLVGEDRLYGMPYYD